MESASTPIIKRFAANGVGWPFCPNKWWRKELQEGVLHLVPFTDAEIAYHFYLIRHRDRWASRSVQAFVEMARSFQQGGRRGLDPRRRVGSRTGAHPSASA